MFKIYTVFFLCAWASYSAEFKYVNEFLDAHPLAASDGLHDQELLSAIQAWPVDQTIKDRVIDSIIAFSAIQVLRGTKAVSLLTPKVLAENRWFDLTQRAIWPQLMEEMRKTNNIKVIKFEAVFRGPVINAGGVQSVVQHTVPSYLFINTSVPKWENIRDYFCELKRSSMVHPMDDRNFVLEGYLFGYFPENIRTVYHRPDSNRRIQYELSHAKALEGLEFLELNVEGLQSGVKKFHVEMKINPCASCGKENAEKKCSGCREVRYCGRDCQVKDWPSHKNRCKK